MRHQGQLPQQPVLRHYYHHHDESHDLDVDEHYLDLDDAYVHTAWQRALHRLRLVLWP